MDVPYHKCSSCLKEGRIQCPDCNFAYYCSEECRNKDKIRHSIQCHHAQRVQQCANCKEKKPKLKFCCSCYYVFYCDRKCQKKDWPHHKQECNKVTEKILNNCADAAQVKNVYSLFLGQSLSHDYLNLINNEGLECDQDLNVLIAGMGDIKNVVKTVAALPQDFGRNVNFILNDLSIHSLARNILFLYLAIADPDPLQMVQIWYSVQLTSSCFAYLKRNLVRLTKRDLKAILTDMKELVDMSEEHWSKCKKVWNGWLQLAKMPELQERMSDFIYKFRNQSFLEERVRLNSLKPNWIKATRDFSKHGILLSPQSPKRIQAIHLNVSLLSFNPAKFKKTYQELGYIQLNFHQYLYCPREEDMIFGARMLAFSLPGWPRCDVLKNQPNSGCVLASYESYLRLQFSEFCSRIEKRLVTFHLIFDSYKHVRYYLEDGTVFDRICMGHLGDVELYPNLLQEFGDLLNKKNPHSVLISHHKDWYRVVGFEQAVEDGVMDQETAEAIQAAEQLAIKDGLTIPSQLSNYRWALCNSNYFDIWPKFFRYLQMQSLIYNISETHEKDIVHPGQIAKKFNLRLRNLHCEQNKVVPCQILEENRIGPIFPNSITLEWIPGPKK